MIEQGRIELYAGDCLIEEAEKNLLGEQHYTICHYLKCKSCSRFFFIGACIRGTPIYKALDNLNDVNLDNMLWGHCGTLYKNNTISRVMGILRKLKSYLMRSV